ncbi:MAG: cytochrome c biogenesis protein CcdA [Candidatus Sumerlaeia bacterium]|nr:cytochrome c biogenesis protein CcdA [Candidatus Sumerlaeia bacterium]
MTPLLHRLLLAVLLSCLTSFLPAQFGTQGPSASEYPATVKAYLAAAPVQGESVEVIVHVKADPGYYFYALNALVDPDGFGPVSTKITLSENPLLEPIEGEAWREVPEPKQKFDKAFSLDVRYHPGETTFRRLYRATQTATFPLAEPLPGFVNMQICDESICLPPRKTNFSLSEQAPTEVLNFGVEPSKTPTPSTTPEATSVGEETATQEKPSVPVQAGAPSEARQLASQGIVKVAGIAFLAGLLSLLTPCVFPMIPLTISFFTKQASKTTAERLALLAVYSGSIVLGFALIGFGLAFVLYLLGFGSKSAGLVNAFAANPWVNITLALLFVGFALSLFGVFELGVPSSWANALQQKKGKRKDWIGAVLMAVIFVLISFTCTAPIVGPLIVLTVQGGVLLPVVGLTFYAIGFALPFLILGLIPSLLTALPKSGDWLHSSKIVFGLVELGVALVYFGKADLVLRWGIFTRELLLSAWVALSVVATLYLLGLFRLTVELHGKEAKPTSIGTGRLTTAVLFGTLAFYFSHGLYGGQIASDLEALLPRSRSVSSPGAASGGVATGHKLPFIENDLDAAFAQAKAEDKPIFLDFTGWTCTNCWRNAIDVFPRPEVSALLEQYVRVALYTDDPEFGPKWQEYQSEKFETFSLPFYALLTSEGEVIATYGGLIREADRPVFTQFLEMGLSTSVLAAKVNDPE